MPYFLELLSCKYLQIGNHSIDILLCFYTIIILLIIFFVLRRSFDIVPVDTNFRNKSPVLYLENCLGLESWCIKHVYMYCYSEIMDRYCPKGRRRVFKVSSLNSDRMIQLLNVTLLLNPDLNTLWNKRRMLLEKSLLDNNSELHFTRLVISRKPKCNDAFAYRRWLLDIIFSGIKFYKLFL